MATLTKVRHILLTVTFFAEISSSCANQNAPDKNMRSYKDTPNVKNSTSVPNSTSNSTSNANPQVNNAGPAKYQILKKAPTKIWSIRVLDKTSGRIIISGGLDWDDQLEPGINEGFVGTSQNWGKDISYTIPRDPKVTSPTGWLFNIDCINDKECWTAGQWCGVFYTPDFGNTWQKSHLQSAAGRDDYCAGGGRFTYGVVARGESVMISGTDANIFRLTKGSKTEFWEAKNPNINYAMFNLTCLSDSFCFSAARKAFMTMPLNTDKVDGSDMTRVDVRGNFSCDEDHESQYNAADWIIADWQIDPKPATDYCQKSADTRDNSFDHGHSLFSTSFVNEKIGFILNGDGSIGKTEDGGKVFKVAIRAKKHLSSISMASEKVGYAGGEKGTLLKTIDGGLTWTQDSNWPANLVGDITAVHFSDEQHGYVGMLDGTLVYWGPSL